MSSGKAEKLLLGKLKPKVNICSISEVEVIAQRALHTDSRNQVRAGSGAKGLERTRY